MLRFATAAVALVVLAAVPAQAADAKLQAAVAAAHRAPTNKARDAARHPAETLAFWGVKPKATVIELSPGAGYWTEILAPYAKATGGKYVTTGADLANPNLSAAGKAGRAAFEKRFGDPAVYGTITVVNFGSQAGPLGAPNSADVVFTSRNIHNFIYQQSMLGKVLKDAYAVLKPGGVLGVEEHRSDPKAETPGNTDGYVATATVIAAAEKAGFKLAARSEVNANPKDTKDHPFGVWTLPPTRWTKANGQGSDPNFDRTRYDAIGESDRMSLRFVKPK